MRVNGGKRLRSPNSKCVFTEKPIHFACTYALDWRVSPTKLAIANQMERTTIGFAQFIYFILSLLNALRFENSNNTYHQHTRLRNSVYIVDDDFFGQSQTESTVFRMFVWVICLLTLYFLFQKLFSNFKHIVCFFLFGCFLHVSLA